MTLQLKLPSVMFDLWSMIRTYNVYERLVVLTHPQKNI